MNSKPLVSIITPFFNAEKYFEETIESVIAQTYDHWELLLVDDGSTDHSTAIAQRYAQNYPDKIKYWEHPGHQNLGKSTSRNLGFNHAKGKYLALLDADDIYLPEKLEQQVKILEDQPLTGMVYGPTLYWYSWTGKARDKRRDYQAKLGVKPYSVLQPPTLMTMYLKKGGIVPCTCGLLVRSQLVQELGGFDEKIQHMYEDQVFLAKICLKTSVFVEGGCRDKYRQHNESSSYVAIREGKYHPALPNPVRLTFLNWLGEYLEQQSIQDPSLIKAYQQSLCPYHHPFLARLIIRPLYLLKLAIWKIKNLLLFVIPIKNNY